MGREIRRVPPHWEHPKGARKWPNEGESYLPMHDRTFAEAAAEWKADFLDWEAGPRPEGCEDLQFWQYDGGPPEPEYYRPEFTEEPTWFQVYETVSEGTPVTPPFASKAELVDYLVERGTFWDQADVGRARFGGEPPLKKAGWDREVAERFVEREHAFSMVIEGGVLKTPRDGA